MKKYSRVSMLVSPNLSGKLLLSYAMVEAHQLTFSNATLGNLCT